MIIVRKKKKILIIKKILMTTFQKIMEFMDKKSIQFLIQIMVFQKKKKIALIEIKKTLIITKIL